MTRQDYSYYWVKNWIPQPNKILIEAKHTHIAFNYPHAQRVLATLLIQYKNPYRGIGLYANQIQFDCGQIVSTYAYYDRNQQGKLPCNIHGLLHYNLPWKGGIREEDHKRNTWAREAINAAPRWHGSVLYGDA